MAGKVGDGGRCAMAFNVLVAGIDRPKRVRDLAAHQDAVVGIARAQRNIRFALGQIDVLVAEHELDLQAGVFGVEPVQSARLGQPKGDGLGACQADDPDMGAAQIAQRLFKTRRRGGNAFGMGQDGSAKLRQLITRG
ncbi:MAG TPA: hypothetical protein DHV08_14920 [Rhodocyclaceae bacterium]|nr:hypothetical protein [Rhodocyclaceae bacterium]